MHDKKLNKNEEELLSEVKSLKDEIRKIKDQKIINELFQKSLKLILSNNNFTETARVIFESCKKITGATAGYVALLDEDGAENKVLFLDDGGRECTVNPDLPMPIRGLRSESYKLSKAVYDNNFSNSHWMKFMPKGHVNLDNVMFAPLIINNKAVGLIGLANKNGNFTDEDAAIASSFGELAAIALQNRYQFEEISFLNNNLDSVNKKLEEEMDKAENIHRSIIPAEILQPEGISIKAHYQPATIMGGDSYNVIRSGNKLIIYVADVMGHGLDGAMISIFIKEAIDSYVVLKSKELYPQKILQHLNSQYHREDFNEEQLICIFLGVIDLDTNELKYSSAGFQTRPLVRMGDCKKDKLETQGLFISNTLPVEMLKFEEQTLNLTPGTTILISTDGLAEQSQGEEMFKKYYEEIFYAKSHLPPEIIVEAINKDFCLFNKNILHGNDDITYLVLQVNRHKKEKHRLEINSDFKEIPGLNDKVEGLISIFPDYMNFITCLHELVVNAIEHGNKFDYNKKVTVDLTITPGYFLAEVGDEGEGFDWCAKVDKSLDMNSYSERGRGIPMSRMLSGNLFYNHKGNKATLLVEIK